MPSSSQSLHEPAVTAEPVDPTTRVEHRDVHAKAVLLTGIGLLLGVWAIVLLLYPLFTYFRYARTGGRTPEKVLVYMPKLPPEPRNESDAPKHMREFRAAEIKALNSYRWVDRGKGIVSIPIDRAMQIIAQKGIPPSAPGGTAYYPPSAGAKITGFEGKVEPQPR